MGIWKRIMDRIRKGKQEEKPEEKTEETPDPELEERSKKIVVCGIDMGKAGGDITGNMYALEEAAVKVGEAIAKVLEAVTIAAENVQADPKMYGDQKEMTNNWRKMHGKPMRRRWSNIVR